MSLTIAVRADDPTPPFEQLRSQIAAAIASGVLVAGTKLPPVRQLAGDLGIATGTVARAYKELEQSGLVTTGRRAGTTVIGRPSGSAESALNSLAGTFIAQARSIGASDDDIRGAIQRQLDPSPPAAGR